MGTELWRHVFSTFYLVCQLLSPYTGISIKHLMPFIYVLLDTRSLELPKQALTEGLLRSYRPWPHLQRITLLICTGWPRTFPGQGSPSVCESWLSTGLKESAGVITPPLFLLQVLTSPMMMWTVNCKLKQTLSSPLSCCWLLFYYQQKAI